MQCFLVVLVAVFVPFAHAYVANKEYPKFAPCDQHVISAIKGYWLISGKPRNVLQGIQSNGDFTVVHTSYDYFNSDNKCIYMNTTNGLMDFTFIPKTGNTTAKTSWIVEEGDDGVIKAKPAENDAPEYRWNWYSIFSRNGVVVCYVCSDVQGSLQPPLIDIMVANRHKNLLAKSAIRTTHSLLQGWGLKFKYDYEQECF